MSSPRNHRPAGTPTGGQFAPTTHAESDVELGTERGGCCTTCGGTGGTMGSPETGGRCWDCQGTGHAHSPDTECSPAAEQGASSAAATTTATSHMHVVHTLPVDEFIERFAPGEYDFDDWNGVGEHESFLNPSPFNPERIHAGTWDTFVADVAANGIREPVTIDWYDTESVSGGHHRIVAAMQTGRDVPFTFDTETRAYDDFDSLPDTAQLAIRHWSHDADPGTVVAHHRASGNRYEIERVPMADMKHRVIDTNAEMAADFDGSFEDYHRWYCTVDTTVPDHGDSRWPVIEAEASLDPGADYLDDGHHRFHSYVRAGDTHVDVLRVLPAR